MPFVNNNTKVCFNEAQYGFTLHAGSSFYLSRLPGELGTFLALTGEIMHAPDVMKTQLGWKWRPNDDNIIDSFSEAARFFERPRSIDDYYGQQDTYAIALKKHREELDARWDIEAAKNLKNSKFRFNEDNSPSTTANADLEYMRNLKQFEDGRRPDMRGTIWNETDDKEKVINYFDHFMSTFNREITLSNRVSIDDCEHLNNMKEINRCFYSNSVEEIKENLRKEGSEWAMKTLRRMEKNSPTAMELSLRLVREAKLSSMGECMRREMVVARNRIQDDEFKHGIEQVLLHSGEPKWAPVDESAIDDYFNGSLDKFLLNFHNGAPMPTRHYWKKYPDILRLWLCERSTWVTELRNDFDAEVRVALRNEGIDVRDSSLSFESARKNLWAKEQYERFQKHRDDLNGRFMNDNTFSDRYYEQVADQIAKLNKDETFFYETINDAIG